jgi:hypothetical protein
MILNGGGGDPTIVKGNPNILPTPSGGAPPGQGLPAATGLPTTTHSGPVNPISGRAVSSAPFAPSVHGTSHPMDSQTGSNDAVGGGASWPHANQPYGASVGPGAPLGPVGPTWLQGFGNSLYSQITNPTDTINKSLDFWGLGNAGNFYGPPASDPSDRGGPLDGSQLAPSFNIPSTTGQGGYDVTGFNNYTINPYANGGGDYISQGGTPQDEEYITGPLSKNTGDDYLDALSFVD